MFCGGKKKKTKTQEPFQIDLNAPNTCKIHQQPFDAICIDSNWSGQRRFCAQCRVQNNIYTNISFKTLEQEIQQQAFFDIVQKLSNVLPKNWDKEWRETIVDRIKNLKNIIMNFEEQLLQNFLLTSEAPKCFDHHDLNMLVDTRILQSLEDLTNQTILVNQMADDDSLYILGKIVHNKQDMSLLLNSIHKDSSLLQNQMKSVQVDLQQKMDQFEKSLQTVNLKYTQNDIQNEDPVFDFIKEAKNQNLDSQNKVMQQIKTISQKQKINQSQKYSPEDHIQIKSLVQLNDEFMVYCTNKNQIHLVKLPELSEFQILEEEGDVMLVSKGMIDDQVHLLVVYEDFGKNFIGVWSLTSLQKLSTITAHESQIHAIIQLPKGCIASCSEDKTVNVFDLKQSQQVLQMQVHQASVNDIALVTTKLIASVSDDQCVALVDYTTGHLEGMLTDDCEIKCVVGVDGIFLATGNTSGVIKIYTTIKMQMVHEIKVHNDLIRSLARVNSKILVTSSWDGTHTFLQIDPYAEIKKIDGPRKKFSEGLVWIRPYNMLLAGSGGRVSVYK